jgi:hypothetical protein
MGSVKNTSSPKLGPRSFTAEHSLSWLALEWILSTEGAQTEPDRTTTQGRSPGNALSIFVFGGFFA